MVGSIEGSVSCGLKAIKLSGSRGWLLLEMDMWKQLKRVTIPVFYGDKRNYQNWKAAFMACVDHDPAIAEYKLLQLRQCLAGEAK